MMQIKQETKTKNATSIKLYFSASGIIIEGCTKSSLSDKGIIVVIIFVCSVVVSSWVVDNLFLIVRLSVGTDVIFSVVNFSVVDGSDLSVREDKVVPCSVICSVVFRVVLGGVVVLYAVDIFSVDDDKLVLDKVVGLSVCFFSDVVSPVVGYFASNPVIRVLEDI